MAIYRGVNGVNRKIKEIYRGTNGVNRKIKEEWRGVKGVNRKVFSSNPPIGILFSRAEFGERQLLPPQFNFAWGLENFLLTNKPSFELLNPAKEALISSVSFDFQGYKQLKISYTLKMAKPRHVGCYIILKKRIDQTLENMLSDEYVSFYTGMSIISIPLAPNFANTDVNSDGLRLYFEASELQGIGFFEIHKIWFE